MTECDFDWVQARADCTVRTVFKRLHEEVVRDLDAFTVAIDRMVTISSASHWLLSRQGQGVPRRT